MTTQAWRVFTVDRQGDSRWAIRMTLWTDKGPTDDVRVVGMIEAALTEEQAKQTAQSLQEQYDRIRK